jgi:hypothetical protein
MSKNSGGEFWTSDRPPKSPTASAIPDPMATKVRYELADYYDVEAYDERFKGPCSPDSMMDILLPLASRKCQKRNSNSPF